MRNGSSVNVMIRVRLSIVICARRVGQLIVGVVFDEQGLGVDVFVVVFDVLFNEYALDSVYGRRI